MRLSLTALLASIVSALATQLSMAPCTPLTMRNGEFALDEEDSLCSDTSAGRFSCGGSGFMNESIPYSRVGDGICDCCDGSDEIDNPFGVVCSDTCSSVLVSRKQALVANYHQIKDGRLTRNKLIEAHQRQLLREEKMLESLKQELEDLDKLKIAVNRWLSKEQSRETWARLAILRKFENECAGGMFETCHVLDEGVKTELQIFQDIIGGGYEDIDHDEDEAAQAAARARQSDEKKRRQRDKAKAGESPRSLEGRDRVMAAECPKLSYEIITESRVSRIHDTLAEYLYFTEGKAGSAARKLTVEQSRRSTTLFGAFLETNNGMLLAAQIVSELAGIAAMPISIPIYVVAFSVERLYSLFTYSVSACAVVRKPPLKYVRVSEKTGLREDITDAQLQAELAANAQADALGDEEDTAVEGNWLDFLYSVATGEYAERIFHKYFKKVSGAYHQGLETVCAIGPFGDGAVWYYEENLPGGHMSVVLEQLDYTRFPLVMDTLQEVRSRTAALRWAFSIAYRSPYMWLKFLFTSSANSKLPVRRDACTLRAAKAVLEEEYDIMKKKLSVETTLIEQKRNQRSNKNKKASTSNNKWKKKKEEENEVPELEPEEMYGPSREWEAVANSECLSSRINGHKYSLCLFRTVKQDSKVIGRFSGWSEEFTASNEGAIDPTQLANLLDPDGYQAVPLLLRMRYTNGEFCQPGSRHREATVQLICGEKPEIVAVDEYETCVYDMAVVHPLACTQKLEDSVMAYLEQANVFGFGKKNTSEKKAVDENTDEVVIEIDGSL